VTLSCGLCDQKANDGFISLGEEAAISRIVFDRQESLNETTMQQPLKGD
jgi:hypothetical protein